MRRYRCPLVLAICLLAGAVTWFHDAAAALPPVDAAACTSTPIAPPAPGPDGDLTLPSPTATAIDQTSTSPADAATIDAISIPIAQSIACQNAGNVLAMLANFSDDWIAERFSGYDTVFYNRFIAATKQASPVAGSAQVMLDAISDVRIRADGAALATVTTHVGAQSETSLLVLVNTGDGWKIDGSAPVTK